jgi:hypothetical protein
MLNSLSSEGAATIVRRGALTRTPLTARELALPDVGANDEAFADVVREQLRGAVGSRILAR